MNKIKNQKQWMTNLWHELEKALRGEDEWNVSGVHVYICDPPLIIRVDNMGDGKFKKSIIQPYIN